MDTQNTVSRSELHKLAEDAFHRHLISGYGDGEYSNEYQIVYQGKPRHFSLPHAQMFLLTLLRSHPEPST